MLEKAPMDQSVVDCVSILNQTIQEIREITLRLDIFPTHLPINVQSVTLFGIPIRLFVTTKIEFIRRLIEIKA